MMAQSACVLLASGAAEGCTPMFTSLDKVKFRGQVKPGDTLETECEITRQRGNFYFAKGKGSVNGKVCVSAEFSLRPGEIRIRGGRPFAERMKACVHKNSDRQPGEIAIRVIRACKGNGHLHRGGVFRSRPGKPACGPGGQAICIGGARAEGKLISTGERIVQRGPRPTPRPSTGLRLRIPGFALPPFSVGIVFMGRN